MPSINEAYKLTAQYPHLLDLEPDTDNLDVEEEAELEEERQATKAWLVKHRKVTVYIK
jgi:hypothetical protein